MQRGQVWAAAAQKKYGKGQKVKGKRGKSNVPGQK
jgi:hypothetical protein